jgi:hypothetical protein
VTGSWRSLKFLPLSNDTNVAIVRELEKPFTNQVDINQVPDAAQVLGVLAPTFTNGTASSESVQSKASDDNRRDGFVVRGTIATDDTNDEDIYSFSAYAGSEVWLDLDKTSSALDTMLELLDASGTVLPVPAIGVWTRRPWTSPASWRSATVLPAKRLPARSSMSA